MKSFQEKEFCDKAYLSTSLNMLFTVGFNPEVIMKIHITNGAKVLAVQDEEQQEILLNRGSKLRKNIQHFDEKKCVHFTDRHNPCCTKYFVEAELIP